MYSWKIVIKAQSRGLAGRAGRVKQLLEMEDANTIRV